MAKGKPIQFLDAKPRDEAEKLWHGALSLTPLEAELVGLDEVLGRVLAADVRAPIDVPPFDRSIVDGYALVAADTFAAGEANPARLRLVGSAILAGVAPVAEVHRGAAVEIATGGVLPRGANAVQMVERTDRDGEDVLVYAAVAPGSAVQPAGSDLRAGDRVLPRGLRLSSRETGVLASLGLAHVSCVRQPRVAVVSTGDELVPPGERLTSGAIYDANSRVVMDALRENGARPSFLGIVPDDEQKLEAVLRVATSFDAVVLSGGTSKGTGDLSFHLIDEIGVPGIIVHGVQVKPGKPLVLASWGGKPVAVLPGFPTSALLTFNLFVRPVIRRLAGLAPEPESATVEARVSERLHSAPGRYEYVMVNLVRADDGALAAYPVRKGSGSISAFSEADGYLEVPESRDLLLEGEIAKVTLFTTSVRPADLVFIGSHCQGVELLFEMLRAEGGVSTKVLSVGAGAGVLAIARGEADFAGVNLIDVDGRYNREALAAAGSGVVAVRGYRRRQGLYYRRDDFAEAPKLAELISRRDLRLISRGRGSGARALLDREIRVLAAATGMEFTALTASLPGYDREARSHNAAAAAVASGSADWGLGIEAAALHYQLGFAPLRDESYDFLVSRERLDRRAVRATLELLGSERFRQALGAIGGYAADSTCGQLLEP